MKKMEGKNSTMRARNENIRTKTDCWTKAGLPNAVLE
jgi:hypothetical protein